MPNIETERCADAVLQRFKTVQKKYLMYIL